MLDCGLEGEVGAEEIGGPLGEDALVVFEDYLRCAGGGGVLAQVWGFS